MMRTTTIIWIACVIFLVAITTKAMAHDSMTDKVNNWVVAEKEKTIAGATRGECVLGSMGSGTNATRPVRALPA